MRIISNEKHYPLYIIFHECDGTQNTRIYNHFLSRGLTATAKYSSG